MNKAVLSVMATMVLSWSLMAGSYRTTSGERLNGNPTYSMWCQDPVRPVYGQIVGFANGRYMWNGEMFNNFDEIAREACMQQKKVIVNKDAIIFREKQIIEECLGNGKMYMCAIRANNDGARLEADGKFSLIQYIPKKEVVIDKNDKIVENISVSDTKTIKKNGYKVAMLIRGYYEIADDSGKRYFFDEKDVIK